MVASIAAHDSDLSDNEKFLKKGLSSDGQSLRWESTGRHYQGIPVIVDVASLAAQEQFNSARIAAIMEARVAYICFQKGTKPNETL